MTHRLIAALAALATLAAAVPAQAQDPGAIPVRSHQRSAPPAAAEGPDFWVGLGGGWYESKGYDVPAGTRNDDSAYTTGGPTGHLTLNLADGRALLRLRGSMMFGYTSNRAEEYAALAGFALSDQQNLWLAAGVSRLSDVSSSRKSPTVGVPVEILFYPARGFELMVHGNFNGDNNFIGIGVSGAIGRARVR